MTPAPPPTARTYAWLAAGAMAFTLYGSLVPFAFAPRPVGDAVAAFGRAMTGRVVVDSRSDAVANVLLGLPLGFALLGATCADRWSPRRAIQFGAALLPACAAFAGLCEFGQLFVPGRTCALSDVVMQTFGAAVGMAAWVLAGDRLTAHARAVWSGPRIGGAAGRLLVGYLAFLAFVQLLPMDLTLNPRDIYHRLRDGHVRVVPFGEFVGADAATVWKRVGTLVGVVALYTPVGLLEGCLPGRTFRSWPEVFALTLTTAFGMEALQTVVMSRYSSGTDVVVGWMTAFAVWWLVRSEADVRPALAAWLVLLLVAGWQPFDFTPGLVGPRLSGTDPVPLLALEGRSHLFALEELLTKMVLLAPVGVAVFPLTAGGPVRRRVWLAGSAGAAISGAVEVGQLALPGHTAAVIDVVLGGVGAWLGAAGASRVRA